MVACRGPSAGRNKGTFYFCDACRLQLSCLASIAGESMVACRGPSEERGQARMALSYCS